MSRKKKNVFNALDISVEKLEEIHQKSKLERIDYVSFDTLFDEKGIFDCAIFKTKTNGKKRVRVMRLLHVKSVANPIRTELDNEKAFRNILNKFAEEEISFVSLYSYKPGENVIVGYGVVMEGDESELEKLKKKTSLYIGSLEEKFRAAYSIIEIDPITLSEEWIFEGFYYDHLTVMRGVPKPDASTGGRVGSSGYSNPPMMGRQVSEILLKGMTANKKGKIAQGHPFLMYSVFDRLRYEEIERALNHIQNTLGKLSSSREIGVSETENFSFPLLFGFGFGEMTGQTHSASAGENNSSTITDSEAVSKNIGNSKGLTDGTSHTSTDGTNSSIGDSKTHTKGGGGNVGLNIGISDSYNWAKSDANGQTSSEGDSHSSADGKTTAVSKTASETYGLANTKGVSEAKGTSITETDAENKGASKSSNMSGGVSGGDGSGISRHQVDHFFQFAIETYLKNEARFQHSLRDGMFDSRSFILTQNEQAKVVVEELVKQSYIDNESPFPVRVLEIEKEEEAVLKKYVKSFAKPLAPELKPFLPERYKYSTYITPLETTAFSLPQENLPGYLSSFDPVPRSIALPGKMEDGAEIGYQLNPALNVLSPTAFNIFFDMLGHIGIFGATNTGKTVFVQKFISSVHNKYDINFMLFDWTRNHRSLIGHLKDTKKFRYNSFEEGYFPLKINLVMPPRGVSPFVWNPAIAELLCYTMGLGERSFRIITKVLRMVQDEAKQEGYVPTMEHLVRRLAKEYARRAKIHADGKNATLTSVSDTIRQNTKFMPSNEQQSFNSMIERMEEWLDPEHPVYKSMCEGSRFMTVEELIAGDFVHLVECGQLPAEVRQFVINGITAAVFYYCKSRDVKLKKPTYLIFEEAHTILKTKSGNEPLDIGETIFETINREARNFNLLIGYICQSPEKLPPLIFDNLPLRVVFQIPDEDGKRKIISAGGKDPIRLDYDLVKWLSRQPMGTCLIRNSKFKKIQDGEFTAVQVHMLPTDELSNRMFKTIYEKSKYKQKTVS